MNLRHKSHRNRSVTRTAGVILGILASLLSGCVQNQMEPAREAGQARWNAARAQVKLQLAEEQFAAGELDTAALTLASARELNPDQPTLALLEARLDLSRGDLSAAQRTLDGANPELSETAERYYLAGMLAEATQAWPEAQAAYDHALQLRPEDFAYLSAAVQVRLTQQRATDALDLLKRAEGLHRWSTPYQILIAECHEQRGDWGRAAEAWGEVVTAEPEVSSEERFALALVRARRFDQARTLLERLTAQTTDTEAKLPLLYALADCYLMLGSTSKAERIMGDALELGGSEQRLLTTLARVAAQQGAWQSASRLADQAVGNAPTTPESIALAAALALKAHDLRTAERHIAALMTIEDLDPGTIAIRDEIQRQIERLQAE